jgi:hypothetical protein
MLHVMIHDQNNPTAVRCSQVLQRAEFVPSLFLGCTF